MAYRTGRCLLKQLLKERKMSQQELADKVKLPRQRISDYANMRTKKMDLDTARTISDALKCSIHDLYEWHEE